MKFLTNKKLAMRIGIITTAITLAGMSLLWAIVSSNTASIVKNDITNQMTDAVESRAAIINDYVASAEEYMAAFALSSEVRELLLDPENPAMIEKAQKYTEDFAAVKGIFEGLYIATPHHLCPDPYLTGSHRHHHAGRRLPEDLPGYHTVPTGTDELGNHEITRHRQHDPLHVLSHL